MPGSIREFFNNIFAKLTKEIKNYPRLYLLLTVIILLAFFVRVYRLDQLLGFFYDQGRDAQVIWDFWHNFKPFLIGPVTGLAGIFLGPFYYYLIAPFYLIGGGNPVVPAVFLAFLVTLGIILVYYLGWKMQDRTTGLIAVLIVSFSYYLVLAGRWLSNPTPIMLSSMVLLLSLWELINNGDKRWWIVTALMVGLSLQFESASAVFYIPLLVVFLFWKVCLFPLSSSFIKGKTTPIPSFKRRGASQYSPLFEGGVGGGFQRFINEFGNSKILLLSLGVFFLTLVPQILFNFRHDNILFNNFKKLFIEEKSFSTSVSIVLKDRLLYFWDVFYSKILVGKPHWAAIFTVFSFAAIIFSVKDLYQKKVVQLFTIFLVIPMLGYIFFQGNHGNIYDYYMTGYYFPMILLFSIGLGILWKHNLGKIVVIVYFILFFNINSVLIKNNLIAGTDGSTHISLGNEMQAVGWILDDAQLQTEEFNIDIYVPPVIPHSYNYLLTWQSNKKCGDNMCGWEREKEEELVYVLFEQDPPHPERLEQWLEDRRENTEVLEEERFGGITVQRRMRI